ncbi:MAG TPA: GNAT family N-acetyltransferase [Stellaceae bacterium]|nr:GNAT family N-acetyltransferase [Stellaceae bacterium]
MTGFTATAVPRIDEVDPEAWDACAGPDNPFLGHAFLSALEDSHSADAQAGWLPQHVLVRDGTGRLVAAAPTYLKSHSYGEYVFDHGWADAYERAGGRYYPKLQCCVPFTPVPGPRLLIRPDAPQDARKALTGALVGLAQEHKVSSLHITFPTEEEWDYLGEVGFLQRIGTQYHWHNDGYRNFDDFLDRLASRKRKQLRKERREAQSAGLDIHTLRGSETRQRHWDAFYRFYLSTVDRKWGSAYLTRRFFQMLPERLGDRIVLMWAERDGEPIAGALNLMGRDTLYGRNWGALDDYKFLHFELCYYRALDFAIEHGLARVEAGAQGRHKIQRGYLPQTTYSAHWLRDAGFAEAVQDFLVREKHAVELEMAGLMEFSPFKRDGDVED